MPHFGEIQSLVGTLRRDGITSRIDNALRVDDSALQNYELREDGGYELREDGSIELRD